MAKQEKGEGDRASARRFNETQTNYVKASGAGIKRSARKAADALDGAEGAVLKRAEKKGRARSKGEDPAVKR